MVHSIGQDGKLRAVSDVWLKKLGYERHEVVGKKSVDFLTEASRFLAETQIVPAFFRTGFVENVEYQMVCKDGSILDVLFSAVLDRTGPHGPASLVVITDVTAQKIVERRLAESEKLYRSLIESQTELVSLAHPDGRLFFVNSAYAAQHGAAKAEMIGRSLYDLIPIEGRQAVKENLARVCASKEMIKTENQILRPDGACKWFSWNNLAIANEDGNIIAIHSVGRDINQSVLAETRLKESEARYRILADNSTDMVVQLDMNRVRRYVSPACRDLFGYEPKDLIGTAVSMVHPDDAGRVSDMFDALLTGKTERHSIEHRIHHRTSDWVWVEADFRLMRDPDTNLPVGIVGALRDISFRKAVEDQLVDANRMLAGQALRDGLTGLDNRRSFDTLFDREFGRARRDAEPLSVLMIDVDWFKSFNDQYGHPEGDICLQRVATAITASLQRPGDIAARYGGEEFVVLLPNTPEDGAAEVASLIIRNVSNLQLTHAATAFGQVTVSIGATTQRREELQLTPVDLLKRADLVLYSAKAGGRNQYKVFGYK